MRTITERVDRGEAVLDRRDPGWWREDAMPAIDLETLDLADGDKCILGQRCPLELRGGRDGAHSGYDRYSRHLSRKPLAMDADWWAVRHGFQAFSDNLGGEYEELAAEWARRIRARRDAA